MSTNPVVRSSRRLPSGRAVVGALLVTLAVFGVLVAARLGTNAEFRDVTVARADLAPGTVLGPDNTAQVTIRLDDSVDTVIENPASIHGAVLLGPVGRLELIQTSNIAETSTDVGEQGYAVVSMAVSPQRVPASLRPGDLISVYATFDDGNDITLLVADKVTVVSFTTDDDGFDDEAVLRIGLDDGETAADLIHASNTGDISVLGLSAAREIELPDTVVRAPSDDAETASGAGG